MRTVATQGRRRAARLAFLLAGLLAAGLAAGCNDSGPGSAVFTRKGEARLRIAVLPFASPSNAPDAGDVVTNTVITYLLSTGAVEVVEPGLVDKAMRAARFMPESAGGLDADTLAALQQNLNVDAYLLGRVEEFGDVRIGPDSYPSVSFSARLVRASDDTIVWAASISRTGADKVKVFDIGRVASIGKLTKAAVAEMAASLRAGAASFVTTPPATGAADAPAPPRPTGVTVPVLPRPQTNGSVPGPKTFALNPVFADEGRTFGQADLVALLADVPGYTRGQVAYTKHAFDTVTALYAMEGGALDLRLVDYQKRDACNQFVAGDSDGLAQEKVDSQSAFSGPSASQTPGVFHLNIAAGRFGLYVTGPESAKEKMRELAIALIAAR